MAQPSYHALSDDEKSRAGENVNRLFREGVLSAHLNLVSKDATCEEQFDLNGKPGACGEKAVYQEAEIASCPACKANKKKVKVRRCIPHSALYWGLGKRFQDVQTNLFAAPAAETAQAPAREVAPIEVDGKPARVARPARVADPVAEAVQSSFDAEKQEDDDVVDVTPRQKAEAEEIRLKREQDAAKAASAPADAPVKRGPGRPRKIQPEVAFASA